jgi:hypothetical protein
VAKKMKNLEKFQKNQIMNLTQINGGSYSTTQGNHGDTFYYSNENNKTSETAGRGGACGDIVVAIVKSQTSSGGNIGL